MSDDREQLRYLRQLLNDASVVFPDSLARKAIQEAQQADQVFRMYVKDHEEELKRYLDLENAAAARFALQISPALLRDFASCLEIQQSWSWPLLQVHQVELDFLTGAKDAAKLLHRHYHSLLSGDDLAAPQLAIRPFAELRVAMSSMAGAEAEISGEIGALLDQAGQLSSNVALGIFHNLDDSLWSANLAAISKWASYHIDFQDIVADIKQVMLPADLLARVQFTVIESISPEKEELERRIERLHAELEQIRETIQHSAISVHADAAETAVRISSEVTERSVETDGLPKYHCYVVDNTLVVRTEMPVLVEQPSTRRALDPLSEEIDRRRYKLSVSDKKETVISSPISDEDFEDEDPLLTTRISWWMTDDHSIEMSASVDNILKGKLELLKYKEHITKEAQILYLLLRYPEGLSFRQMVKEMYPDDYGAIQSDTNMRHILITRAWSLLNAISKKCRAAGINPRVLPDSWKRRTINNKIHLRVARVVEIHGEKERSKERGWSLIEDHDRPARGLIEDHDCRVEE